MSALTWALGVETGDDPYYPDQRLGEVVFQATDQVAVAVWIVWASRQQSDLGDAARLVIRLLHQDPPGPHDGIDLDLRALAVAAARGSTT